MVTRIKIDTTISRKAHNEAARNLRKAHSEEYMDLLDAAYTGLGVESPRQRRVRKAQEAADARLLAAQKKQAREQRKIEEARALLEAAGLSVFDGSEAVSA